MKTTNRKCSEFVTRCEPFTGSNLTGVRISDSLYIVYSYGWYPLWAKISEQWYGHNGKYSSTTSAQQSGSTPDASDIIILDNVEQLKTKIAEARN